MPNDKQKGFSLVKGNKVVVIDTMNGNININNDVDAGIIFLGMLGVALEHAMHNPTTSDVSVSELLETIHAHQPILTMHGQSINVDHVVYNAWLDEDQKQIALVYEIGHDNLTAFPSPDALADHESDKYIPVVMQIDDAGGTPSVKYMYLSQEGVQITADQILNIDEGMKYLTPSNDIMPNNGTHLSKDIFHPITLVDAQSINEHVDRLAAETGQGLSGNFLPFGNSLDQLNLFGDGREIIGQLNHSYEEINEKWHLHQHIMDHPMSDSLNLLADLHNLDHDSYDVDDAHGIEHHSADNFFDN